MKQRVRSAGRETFRSMKIRNFRLFFSGQIISQVGNWMTMVTQTLLVLHLTNNSGLAIGVLAACQFGPVLILGAWTGLVADRSDKRKLLIIVQAVAMVQSFMLAALAFHGSPPVLAVFAVATIGGVTTAFDNPARRAFVSEMVPEDHVQNAVSLNTALMTSSRIVGPAVAGLLAVTAGYGWSFALDGLSYIAVIIGLWMMRPSELRVPPQAIKAKGQVRAGLRYVFTVPELWLPLTMMAVVGTLAFNFQVVIPLFVYNDFGGTTTQFTLLFSVISVGSVIGALVAARRVSVSITHVVVASTFFGLSMILLAIAPSLAVAYPLAIIMGGGSVAFMTTSTAIVQLRSSAEMRGRVLALQAMVFLGSTPIGGPLLGWVCDAYGARTGLVIGGLSGLAAAAGGYAINRRYQARERLLGVDEDTITTVELQSA